MNEPTKANRPMQADAQNCFLPYYFPLHKPQVHTTATFLFFLAKRTDSILTPVNSNPHKMILDWSL
jgi:hypothetical protein